MNKSKVIVLALSLGLVFTACQNDQNTSSEDVKSTEVSEDVNSNQASNNLSSEEKSEDKSNEEISLADWEGEWNDMGGYLDKDEVQEAFKTLAENENVSEEEAKSSYLEKRHCDFKGLRISGDKVEFLNDFPEKNPDALGEGEYEFVEKREVDHAGHKMEWDIFKAKSDDAPYKYLLMMPIHGEESLTHYHMRYGDDVESLVNKEGWFPTFVKPNTTDSQIIDEISE